MRKISLYMFTTLDGFIAGPNGEFDDYEPSDEEMDFANEFFAAHDGLVFGRKTYAAFAAYWDPIAKGQIPAEAFIPPRDLEFADIFSQMTRIVISKTLTHLNADPRAILIQDDLAAQLTALKHQPGRDLLLICGPDLLAALLAHHLVDEFRLLIKPSVLGHGFPLFGGLDQKLNLKLLSTRAFHSGTVMHQYQVT